MTFSYKTKIITLNKCHIETILSNTKLKLKFPRCTSNTLQSYLFMFNSGFGQGMCIAFSFHIQLISLNLQQPVHLYFVYFMALTFYIVRFTCLVKYTTFCIYLWLPHKQIQIKCCCQQHFRDDAVCVPLHYIRNPSSPIIPLLMMLSWSTWLVVSSRSLHSKGNFVKVFNK